MPTDPNSVTIYSPEGEVFEMSRANARDLHNHRGWSYSPPAGVTPPPAPVEETVTESEEEAEDAATGEGSGEASDEAGEAEDGETIDEGSEEEGTDETSLRLTEEDFADLTTKDAVLEYLAAEFPDFKPHHLAQRESLVKKAIELAKA